MYSTAFRLQFRRWRSRRLSQVVAASLAVGFGIFAAQAVWASSEVGDTLVGVPRIVDGDTLVVSLCSTLLYNGLQPL